MGSRIRENPDKIFQCFLEIVSPSEANNDPWILQKFPDSFNNEEVLKAVTQFAYPCSIESNTVQHFSFVLTNIDSKWTFGYCRHAPASPTCFCILSYLPWHETFYKLLDKIAEVTRHGEASDLGRFLEAVHTSLVPIPGTVLRVADSSGTVFEVSCPDHRKLPSFPENRNLNEYYNAVDVNNMILIFASMLNERRVLITSSKLGRLSACVQAASALIYPMHWQHIFIPVLPTRLLDYLSAPMPFLIGVPTPVFEHAKRSEMGDVVILYADTNTVESPFDDLQSLPLEVTSGLKRRLKNTELLRGDGIARAFLHALVQLIGGYRDALTFRDGERISFCRDTFLQTRPNNMQPYLERMLHLQIFHQFIEERLDMLNSGKGFNDIFEEVSLETDKSGAKFKKQYKDWMANMKKEGGALLRTVKSKTNPAVKHAYKHGLRKRVPSGRSMKDKSRKAYKEVKSMFQDPMLKDVKYSPHPAMVTGAQPRSAPSSPTTLVRPTTIHGTKLSRSTSHQRSVVSYVRPREGLARRTVNGRIDLIKKSNEYSPLKGGPHVSEVAPFEESSDSPEDRCSSPDLSVQRINMDLMGDLQDLIFRRCSMEDDRRGSASAPVATVSKTRVPETDDAVPSSRDSANKPREEVQLIRLDSEESADIVFDPLLASDVQKTPAAVAAVAPLPAGGVRTMEKIFQLGEQNVDNSSQRFTVPTRSPSSPLSPGFNNPVYFHVTPVPSPTFANQAVASRTAAQPFVRPPAAVFFPANDGQRGSEFKGIGGGSGIGRQTLAGDRVVQGSTFRPPHGMTPGVAPNNNNNNNNQTGANLFVLAPPTPSSRGGSAAAGRLSAAEPQNSFLHSRASALCRPVAEKTQLFEDLLRWDGAKGGPSAGSDPNSNHVSTVGQTKLWQTFD